MSSITSNSIWNVVFDNPSQTLTERSFGPFQSRDSVSGLAAKRLCTEFSVSTVKSGGRPENGPLGIILASTFGVAGCFDVAGMGDLAPQPEDFGQTLGYWGIGNGPYLVLPFLGPSTVRDTVGKGGNYLASIQTWIDPDWVGWTIWGVDMLDTRTRLLDLDEVADTAVDPYAQVRDAYLSYRRNLVYDGNPPADEEGFLEDPGDEPAPKASPAAAGK